VEAGRGRPFFCTIETMLSLLVALMMAQDPGCSGEGAALMKAASERARAFDVAGAAARLKSAAARGCAEAELASVYLRGYLDARAAYRFGGSPESLEPVRAAMARLKSAAQGTAALPGIAAFVLQAAAAASQGERDELALVIEHAVQLEAVRLSAGLPGAPMITAHEAAGDLWLQVHRYEDARRAYVRAAERIGATPRVTLGLARTAARLNDIPAACTHYRSLFVSWNDAAAEPQEIADARAFLLRPACLTPGTLPR
jgi:hypothetical protein